MLGSKARNDVATTKPEPAMATPAIGDDIIDPSKFMDLAAARARSFTTPTARSVQHADETGSDFGSTSRVSCNDPRRHRATPQCGPLQPEPLEQHRRKPTPKPAPANTGPTRHWPKPTLALTMEWQSTAAQCLPRRRSPSERFPYTCGSPTTPIRAGVSYMSG